MDPDDLTCAGIHKHFVDPDDLTCAGIHKHSTKIEVKILWHCLVNEYKVMENLNHNNYYIKTAPGISKRLNHKPFALKVFVVQKYQNFLSLVGEKTSKIKFDFIV